MHKLLINRISIAPSFRAGIDCSSFTDSAKFGKFDRIKNEIPRILKSAMLPDFLSPALKDGAIDSSLYRVYGGDMKNIDIELYKTRKELIRQTAGQIIRDFERFGLDVFFTGNTEMAYEELFAQMVEHINQLLNHNFEKLLSLLYQIDVSESRIYEKELDYPEYSKAEIISELVIHRELKKVITRNYFKSNKKI
jgi:hypothetical protein